MRYLVTSAEMKAYDKVTTESIGIPAMVLMERAALETFHALEDKKLIREGAKALILAGYGNNGGDGLALCRMLLEAGMETKVWLVGDEKKASREWLLQKEILKEFPVQYVNNLPDGEFDLIVDALFGVGLSRELSGEYARAVNCVNEKKGFKLAMDLPSGVSADDGRILGTAFRADLTVTYGFEKLGLWLLPGKKMVGEVILADVGITARAFRGASPEHFTLDEEWKALLPTRKEDGNKGTFGKALLLAGSFQMAGAAILGARACYRTGAGMVKVLTVPENRVILQETVPEALLGDVTVEREILNSFDWCDVICVGPGLGKGEAAKRALRRSLERTDKPLVIDADGLNLLSESEELMTLLKSGNGTRRIVLTPHAAEFVRLWNGCCKGMLRMEEYKRTPDAFAKKLAAELGVTIAAKDATTYVCGKDRPVYVNLSGNSALATAGSGDVLAGILTAFLCQEKESADAFMATCRAVRLHGLLGELASARLGEHGVMAGDLTAME